MLDRLFEGLEGRVLPRLNEGECWREFVRLLSTVRKHNKHGDIARGVRVGNDFGKIMIASDGGASVRMILDGTMRPIVITERATPTSGVFRFDDEIDGATLATGLRFGWSGADL